jgi:hypothetical protein
VVLDFHKEPPFPVPVPVPDKNGTQCPVLEKHYF